MQREFNQGVNQLPISSVGVNQYPLSAKVVASEPTGVHNGCFEIDEYDEATATYQLKQPTEASLPTAQVLFTSAKGIEDERVPAGYCDPARWVAFDTAGGTPTVGDDVGTQASSYKLIKGSTGFKCLAYNSTEELCLVRPFSSGVELVDGEYMTTSFSDNDSALTVASDAWETVATYTLTTEESDILIIRPKDNVFALTKNASDDYFFEVYFNAWGAGGWDMRILGNGMTESAYPGGTPSTLFHLTRGGGYGPGGNFLRNQSMQTYNSDVKEVYAMSFWNGGASNNWHVTSLEYQVYLDRPNNNTVGYNISTHDIYRVPGFDDYTELVPAP